MSNVKDQIPENAGSIVVIGENATYKEGVMYINNHIDFMVDGHGYEITVDGYMTHDFAQRYNMNECMIPDVLDQHRAVIHEFMADTPYGVDAYYYWRRFFLVDSEKDQYRIFTMLDKYAYPRKAPNPEARDIESINLLAEYLGEDPKDWKEFIEYINKGDPFCDRMYAIKVPIGKGDIKRITSYDREILIIPDDEVYDNAVFDPKPIENKLIYVNHDGVKSIMG